MGGGGSVVHVHLVRTECVSVTVCVFECAPTFTHLPELWGMRDRRQVWIPITCNVPHLRTPTVPHAVSDYVCTTPFIIIVISPAKLSTYTIILFTITFPPHHTPSNTFPIVSKCLQDPHTQHEIKSSANIEGTCVFGWEVRGVVCVTCSHISRHRHQWVPPDIGGKSLVVLLKTLSYLVSTQTGHEFTYLSRPPVISVSMWQKARSDNSTWHSYLSCMFGENSNSPVNSVHRWSSPVWTPSFLYFFFWFIFYI